MTRGVYGFAMLVAVGIAGAVLLNRTQLMNAAEGMAHAQQVSAAIEAARDALRRVERAARDFVVAGTQNTYSNYASARKEVSAAVAELRLLTDRNPGQQEDMNRAEGAVEHYLGRFDEALSVRRSQGTSKAQRLLEEVSWTPMVDVLQSFDGIRAEESRALENSRTALLRVDRVSNLGLAAAFALMIAMQLSALIGSARNQRQTEAAQSALLRANERLEDLVEERTAKLASANQEMENEIAQRRRAMEQLNRLRAIIDRSNDFVGLADPNGNFSYVNAAGRRMTGYSEGESIKGLSVAAFQPWVYELMVSERQRMSPTGDLWAGESVLIRAMASRSPYPR